jgi:hypothetical protein
MDSNNRIVPTHRDVLNGRGQGVQRHPGNVKYRKLVFVNKVSSPPRLFLCVDWRCRWRGLRHFTEFGQFEPVTLTMLSHMHQ